MQPSSRTRPAAENQTVGFIGVVLIKLGQTVSCNGLPFDIPQHLAKAAVFLVRVRHQIKWANWVGPVTEALALSD